MRMRMKMKKIMEIVRAEMSANKNVEFCVNSVNWNVYICIYMCVFFLKSGKKHVRLEGLTTGVKKENFSSFLVNVGTKQLLTH